MILLHRFENAYVYAYSSNALPGIYLVATLWAGQEGSFLLWAFFAAMLGRLAVAKGEKDPGCHNRFACCARYVF